MTSPLANQATDRSRLTLSTLRELPVSLALRVISELSSRQPAFAAAAWVDAGCIAHTSEARSLNFGDEDGWRKYPCAPIALARNGHWDATQTCLEGLLALRTTQSEAKRAGKRSSIELEGSDYDYSAASNRISRLQKGEFINRLASAFSEAPPQRCLSLTRLALLACGAGLDTPPSQQDAKASPSSESRSWHTHGSMASYAQLASRGQAGTIEALAPWLLPSASLGYASEKEFKALETFLISFCEGMPRTSERGQAMAEAPIGWGPLARAAMAKNPSLGLLGQKHAEAPIHPFLSAQLSPNPDAVMRALCLAPPLASGPTAQRWLAQSSDPLLMERGARGALDEMLEHQKREHQTLLSHWKLTNSKPRARASKKSGDWGLEGLPTEKPSKSATAPALDDIPLGLPRSISLALLDLIHANEPQRVQALLSVCQKVGLTQSSDPMAPLPGSPLGLLPAAIQMGRAGMALQWAQGSTLAPLTAREAKGIPALEFWAHPQHGPIGLEQAPGAHWATFPPQRLGGLLDAREGLGKLLAPEPLASLPSALRQSAVKMRLSPLTACLMMEDKSLAMALSRRFPKPEAALDAAAHPTEELGALGPRIERARMELSLPTPEPSVARSLRI